MSPTQSAPIFPEQVRLDLSELQRSLLDYLAERLPYKTMRDILAGVFARGLVVAVGDEREKEGRVVEGYRHEISGLNALGTKIPFGRPKYRKPSPVPEEVVVRLDNELRDRLERLLLRGGADLKSLIETALRAGLDESSKPGAGDPGPVFEQLKGKEASERAAARARRRKRVARLYALASS